MNKRLIRKYCITGCCLLVGLVGAFVALPYLDKMDKTAQGGFETPVMPGLGGIGNNGLTASSMLDDVAVSGTEDSTSGLSYAAYRVKQGDMIGFIAEDFGVTQDTIISVNNIRQSRLIQPGQYLKIPSMPGILYTVRNDGENLGEIAEKYEISLEKCALVNNLQQEVSLSAGTTLFLPDAELDWVTRQEINGDLFKRPIKKGRYYFSSYWGWRSSPFTGKRSFHGGIDMAASKGTAVYAALDGEVVETGFNATYGNYVIIKHHSGYRSLYAHLSEINTTRGRFVYTNTVIGKVGSTGLSTGPHLHFAVYKNGSSVNPQNLWN